MTHRDESGTQGATHVPGLQARLRYDGYGEIEAPSTTAAVASTTCAGEAGGPPGGRAEGAIPEGLAASRSLSC